MRHSLGTAVFSGMLGVTLFGIFLTPVFFYVIQGLGEGDFSGRDRSVIGRVAGGITRGWIGFCWRLASAHGVDADRWERRACCQSGHAAETPMLSLG